VATRVQYRSAMRIKIYGGTPRDSDTNLCESCRASRIVRGRTLDEEIVFCDAMAMSPVRIPFKVTDCSSYDDQRMPTYAQLAHQAWILVSATRRRPAGFVRAAELPAMERYKFLRQVDEE
jgi:hypothetical protein